MPTYRLSYFEARGASEVTRYLFALAGVEYEDVRYSREEWAKVKEGHVSPFGVLPVLEIDGKVYCQSLAIAQYIARTFGLAGKNNEEEYKVLVVQGAYTDFMLKFFASQLEQDDEKKASLQKDLTENFIPNWLRALEEIFQQGKGKFFVGDDLTVGDLYFLHTCEYLKGVNSQVLDQFPGLNGLFNRIVENPKIAAWREKRPVTQF